MIRNALHLLVAILAWVGAMAAASGSPPLPSTTDLLGSTWVVSVAGEPRPRSMRIDEVRTRADGALELIVQYGWADNRGKQITADLVASDQSWELSLTTPAGSRIVAKEVATGLFKGSFKASTGRPKDVALSRVDAPPSGAPESLATPAAPTLLRAADNIRAHDVVFVWMGGNDCPPCRAWRGVELPKLRTSDEFRAIRFVYVIKTITQAVPPAMFLPDEVKPFKTVLDAASGGGPGSPQAALLVDGQVYDYFFGVRSADDVEKMLRAIRTGTPYPFRRCERMSSLGRGCERYAPAS